MLKMAVFAPTPRASVGTATIVNVGFLTSMVVAFAMNNEIALMEAGKLSPGPAEALRQNTELAQQFSKEIRTISHLLHPAASR
jgi:hypothetical protein